MTCSDRPVPGEKRLVPILPPRPESAPHAAPAPRPAPRPAHRDQETAR